MVINLLLSWASGINQPAEPTNFMQLERITVDASSSAKENTRGYYIRKLNSTSKRRFPIAVARIDISLMIEQ